MPINSKLITRFVAASAVALFAAAPATAEMSTEELAAKAQNPIANMISAAFQNNTNLNFGPEEGTQNIFNIQPVIPFAVNSDWNIITRTILPVISQPALSPTDDRTNGIGDTQFSTFLTPARPGNWIWGGGPVVQLPTNNDPVLGNNNWGMGLTGVVLRIEKGDPWVYGVLVNNVWSLSDDKRGGDYNSGFSQVFVNYNLPDGAYFSSAPIITANWKADNSQRWTVPLGGGMGKIFRFPGLPPINAQLGAYYNVVKPDDGANWQIRTQANFLFPK